MYKEAVKLRVRQAKAQAHSRNAGTPHTVTGTGQAVVGRVVKEFSVLRWRRTGRVRRSVGHQLRWLPP